MPNAAGFLEQPPAGVLDATLPSLPSERPGVSIGPYKLLEQIGEGGMGVVWRAVDRALSGEILAQRFQCSRNRAWRVAADAGPGDGVLFVDDPRQIEGAVTAAGSPHGDPTGLGPLLDALTSAMVDAGWDRWDARSEERRVGIEWRSRWSQYH